MINKLKKIRYTSLLVFFFFAYDLIYSISMSLVKSAIISNCIGDGIIIILFLLAIKEKNFKIKLDSLIIILLSATSFLLSLWINPNYKSVMFDDNAFNIFKMIFSFHGGIFAYFIVRLEDNSEDLLHDLKLSIIPVWICYTIKTIDGISFSSISRISGNTIVRNYNQVYGFKFLFVAIFLTYMYYKERKKRFLLLSFIAVGQILLYASRTAILSYVFYIILIVLFENNDKNKNYKKALLGIIIFAGITLITSNTFMMGVSDFCTKHHISSKIIDSFINNNNHLDGGRVVLWKKSLTLINSNLFGMGVYSDHYYLNVYVHNIILQIFMSYGVLIGLVIVLWLIKTIYTMLFKSCGNNKSLFIIFFSLSFIRLMLSYSFWYDINFWIMLAIYSINKDEIINNKLIRKKENCYGKK